MNLKRHFKLHAKNASLSNDNTAKKHTETESMICETVPVIGQELTLSSPAFIIAQLPPDPNGYG